MKNLARLLRSPALVLAVVVVAAPACKTKLVDEATGDGRPASGPAVPTPGTGTPSPDDTGTGPTSPAPSPGDVFGHGDEWNAKDPGYAGKPDDEPPVEEEPPTMMRSTKNDLIWKRFRAVERDVMKALGLTKSELCNEVGSYSCVDRVHLAPLGGNEPFEAGQYTPVPSPTATTAAALERVVLSGCAARVAKDKQGAPVVFTELTLDGPPLDDASAADVASADATVTALYRRFLARDPLAAELEAARALLVDDEGAHLSPETFAVAACFAVGTTAENFFY